MADEFEPVRAAFERAEDVAPEPGLTPPEEEASAPPRTPADPPSDLPEDPKRRASRLPLNDYGNGQRFVIHFGEDVMFVPRVGWFTWTGKVWKKDPDELAVRAKAHRIAGLIAGEVEHIQPTPREVKVIARERELQEQLATLDALAPAERAETHDKELALIRAELRGIEATLKTHKSRIGRILTHAKNAGNNGPLNHLLTESSVSLAVPLDDLDAHPLDVNTASGLMRFRVEDMTEEGGGKMADLEILPHARRQLQTKIVPHEVDRTKTAPLFEKFLAEVQPDIEMRAFLQRWFGLSMTAVPIQRLVFFYGTGRNGKSVLVDTMARIVGDYAASARIESLTGSNRRGGGDATPDLIPLIGARLVRTSEPDQGERLQEALIKELTGGEPINVRALHSDFVEIRPVFKLTMSGNHKPDIRGGDDGIWGRLLLVPWDVRIPDDRQDQNLVEKLMGEAPGILNWMIEGLLDYLEGGLRPPAVVTEATQEYREESDPIGTFLTSCCTITGNFDDKLLSSEISNAFNYHQMERGLNQWKPGTFTRQFSTKAKTWKHPHSGLGIEKSKASLSQYTGLRFTDDFGRRWRDAPKDHQGRALSVASGPEAGSHPAPPFHDF
ncbi:primase [Emiliania huxleyi virus PS401]|nr:primase [Emiliania huxleyi virus PS401]